MLYNMMFRMVGMMAFSVILITACKKDKDIQQAVDLLAAPFADAGESRTINVAEGKILLDGSVARLGNPNPVKCRWEIISGPAGAIITNPENFDTEITGISIGNYWVRITITNLGGSQKYASDSALLFVKENIAPTINAGDDLLYYLPNTDYIQFIGVANHPYDAFTACLVRQISGPVTLNITKWNTSPYYYLTDLQTLGEYKFEWSSSNNYNMTGRDTMTITILPPISIANGLEIHGLRWDCHPFGNCYLMFNSYVLNSFIPIGKTMKKVYISNSGKNSWREVKQGSTANAFYDLYDGKIDYLFTLDGVDKYLSIGSAKTELGYTDVRITWE